MNALRDPGEFIPGASDLHGVAEPERHHPEGDSGAHLELVLRRAWEETGDLSSAEALPLRMAALFHDAGKAVTGCGPLPPDDAPSWRAFREARLSEFRSPALKPDGTPSHALHDRIGAAGVEAIAFDLGLGEGESTFCAFVAGQHMRMHALLDDSGSLAVGPKGLRRFVCDVLAVSDGLSPSAFVRVCRADARGRAGRESEPYPQGAVLEAAIDTVRRARERDEDETRRLKARWDDFHEIVVDGLSASSAKPGSL